MMMNKNGFTLLEVAIILMIVSILVAIAIPQFRTAEVNSKISLIKGQLNTMAMAMEAYCTDNMNYPLSNYSSPAVPAKADDGRSSKTSYYLLKPLTSPIVYMTRIPEDPFADKNNLSNFDQGYGRYGHLNAGYSYRHAKGSSRHTFPAYPQYDQDWVLSSVGPNGIYDIWGTSSGLFCLYDPTNGVISNGDITRFQKPDRGYN